MASYIQTPSHDCSGKEAIQFLETVQVGENFRMRLKKSSLDEGWQFATAQRSDGAWELCVDGEQPEVIQDDNEADSLLSTDNWEIGWYSFVQSAQIQSNTEPAQAVTSSSANGEVSENSGIVLQWEDFTFWGEQTQLVCDNSNAYCLYPNVSLKGKIILQPKHLVNGENSLLLIFYFVAVPICGDLREENAQHFKSIVYNIKDEKVQFVPFLAIGPETQLDSSDQRISIDWEKAQNTMRSFFTNPSYTELGFNKEVGEECVISKVVASNQIEISTNLPKRKPRGRGVWARRGMKTEPSNISTAICEKRTRQMPKRFDQIEQQHANPAKKMKEPSQQKAQPTPLLKPLPKALPRATRTKSAEKTQAITNKALKQATESSPAPLDSSLKNISKLDKLLTMVGNMETRLETREASRAPGITPHESLQPPPPVPTPTQTGPILPAGALVYGHSNANEPSFDRDSPMTRAMQAYIAYLSMKKLFR